MTTYQQHQQQQRKAAREARVEQVRRDLEAAIAEVEEEIRSLEAALAAKREMERLQHVLSAPCETRQDGQDGDA